MVRALARGLLGLAIAAGGPALADDNDTSDDPSRSVGSAMGKGSYPWYDSPRDEFRPVKLPREGGLFDSKSSSSSSSGTRSEPPSPPSGWTFGSAVSYTGFGLALAALIGLLVWFWRMYEPSADSELDPRSKAAGDPTPLEELPAGLRLGYDPSDPWSEAIRRRDRGDLAGAIVCLFAHQLLTLSRLGLVRLAPGKTGRQLLRSVADAEFRGLVAPTLRLFEAAYYGHHQPSAEDFGRAWASAEAFERRAVAGMAR